MNRCFTAPAAWHGGFYELAMEFCDPSVEHLTDALRTLWSHQDLRGCYRDRDREPSEQERLAFDASLLDEGHILGLALLPTGHIVNCGTCTVHEDAGSDWICFYLPMGGLGRVLPTAGFPFDDGARRPWRRAIDDWLVGIGSFTHSKVPFQLGLVGFEVSGTKYAKDLQAGVPDRRKDGVLLPEGRGLAYFARTEGG